MKQILSLALVLLFTYGNQLVSAQESNEELIAHFRNNYYILYVNGTYIIEQLNTLKYSAVRRDTLLPIEGNTTVLKGKLYELRFVDNKPSLEFNIKNKRKNKNNSSLKLEKIDEKAIKNRNRKINHFYYKKYAVKISDYARFLHNKDKNGYIIFDSDRELIYININLMGITDFKNWLDSFLKRHNLL